MVLKVVNEMGLKKAVEENAAGISSALRKAIPKMTSLKTLLLQLVRQPGTAKFSNFRKQKAVKEEADEPPVEKRKILVSSCLYGNAVRYNGCSKALRNEIFLKWKEEGRLIPVCPELDGGLDIPRMPSERTGRKVIRFDGEDMSSEYAKGSIHALQAARENHVAFAVMKEKSPACGSSLIYDGEITGKTIHGEGTAVELLRNAGITVFSEHEIMEAAQYLEVVESGGKAEPEDGTIHIRSGIMRGNVK